MSRHSRTSTASQQQSRTPAERQRLLAEAVADFPRFCGLLQVRLKSSSGADTPHRAQMVLTPLQRAYNAKRTSRDIILKPRQVFFTTLEGARDVWWFLTKRGAHVLVVCQSQSDQKALKDIADKFRIFFDSLRRLGVSLNFGKETGTEWTLPERDATLSVIQAGASAQSADRKGRGGTISRLHLTESAFWGDYAEKTFLALTESVPREGSEIVNESTANGAGGFYYDQWRAAVNGNSIYQPYFVRWWEHPEYAIPGKDADEEFVPRNDLESALLAKGVTPAQLNWYRWKVRDKGGNEELVAQEYPSDPDTCFLLSGRCFFDNKLLSAQIAEAMPPIRTERQGRLRIWQDASPGLSYVIGADTAEGGGGDPSGAVVIERGSGTHVATLRGQYIPWDFAGELAKLSAQYNGATVAVERNNHGHSVLQALQRDHGDAWKHVYRHRDTKPGWLTNEASRAPMLDDLDSVHRRGSWRTDDTELLGEMTKFVITDDGKPEASAGAHDDLVMAAAIAWAVSTRTVRKGASGGGFYAGVPIDEVKVGD